MPRAKKEPWRCKATSEQTRKRCKLRAGDDGWCWRHRHLHKKTGPKTTAGLAATAANLPPAGNWKHGQYAEKWLSEEQRESLQAGRSLQGSLEVELAKARMRLTTLEKRMYLRETGQETGDELVEVSQESDAVPGGASIPGQPVPPPITQRIRIKRKTSRMTYADMLILWDRLVARIADLETRSLQLRVEGAGRAPDEVAEQYRVFLKQHVGQGDISPAEYQARYLSGPEVDENGVLGADKPPETPGNGHPSRPGGNGHV